MNTRAVSKTLVLSVPFLLTLTCKPPEPFGPGMNRYRFTASAIRTVNPGVISAMVMVEDVDAMRFFSTQPFSFTSTLPDTGRGISDIGSAVMTATMTMNPDGLSATWKAELRKSDLLIADKVGTVSISSFPKPK